MASEHTPVPWFAQPPSVDEDPGVTIISLRLGDDGTPMETPTNGIVAAAMMLPTEIDAKDSSRAEANAAFIVRACNNHGALVALLNEAAEFIQPFNRAEDLSDRIEAALAAVEP